LNLLFIEFWVDGPLHRKPSITCAYSQVLQKTCARNWHALKSNSRRWCLHWTSTVLMNAWLFHDWALKNCLNRYEIGQLYPRVWNYFIHPTGMDSQYGTHHHARYGHHTTAKSSDKALSLIFNRCCSLLASTVLFAWISSSGCFRTPSEGRLSLRVFREGRKNCGSCGFQESRRGGILVLVLQFDSALQFVFRFSRSLDNRAFYLWIIFDVLSRSESLLIYMVLEMWKFFRPSFDNWRKMGKWCKTPNPLAPECPSS